MAHHHRRRFRAATAAALLVALSVLSTAQAKPPSKETAWVRSAFARCVRTAESGNGTNPAAYGNLYGIQGPADKHGDVYSWAHGVSRQTQDRIAYRLFLRSGDYPWRSHDGCAA